jgi:hypothetical protein
VKIIKEREIAFKVGISTVKRKETYITYRGSNYIFTKDIQICPKRGTIVTKTLETAKGDILATTRIGTNKEYYGFYRTNVMHKALIELGLIDDRDLYTEED